MPVLLEDLLVDDRRDLNLAIESDSESAGIEELFVVTLVDTLARVLRHLVVVIREIIELLLVNKADALVDQDVGVLGLVAALVLNDL